MKNRYLLWVLVFFCLHAYFLWWLDRDIAANSAMHSRWPLALASVFSSIFLLFSAILPVVNRGNLARRQVRQAQGTGLGTTVCILCVCLFEGCV